LIPWHDGYRVKHLTGDPSYAPPLKANEIAQKPTTKIIQGDWNWHANRPRDNPKTSWHGKIGVRGENMLFGDSHVEFYKFPDEMDNWGYVAVDNNFSWW
jgi:hypothetical protein